VKVARSCPPYALIFSPGSYRSKLSTDKLDEKHCGAWHAFFKAVICRRTCAFYVHRTHGVTRVLGPSQALMIELVRLLPEDERRAVFERANRPSRRWSKARPPACGVPPARSSTA
jgi:hypothetical protein